VPRPGRRGRHPLERRSPGPDVGTNLADSLRRYCDAMEHAFGGHTKTMEWVAWTRAYITHLDPLTKAPETPQAPEATPDELQRHLPDGWSARGAEYGSVRP
jgi:hypothetical protein